MNLIDKIRMFEALPQQTVAEFNKLFTNCKLDDLAADLEVEIGELADSDTTRMLSVGKLTVKHRFVPVDVVEITEEGYTAVRGQTLFREKRNVKASKSWRA